MTNAATTASTTLTPRTWGLNEPWVEVTVPVTFRKREHGLGYYVTRADTGQDLGMVGMGKNKRQWIGHLLNSAYYPADADIVVRATKHRNHGGDSWAHGEVVSTGSSRMDVVNEMVSVLLSRRAESLEDLVSQARAPFLAKHPELAP